MEFKHFVYVVALGSVIWAVTVAALVSYEDISESVAIKGELPYEEAGSFLKNVDQFDGVRRVLNVVLPLGLLCILYLAYTYRINPIGLGSMVVVVVSFLFASDSILDAKESVEREYEVEMANLVWWLSSD